MILCYFAQVCMYVVSVILTNTANLYELRTDEKIVMKSYYNNNYILLHLIPINPFTVTKHSQNQLKTKKSFFITTT